MSKMVDLDKVIIIIDEQIASLERDIRDAGYSDDRSTMSQNSGKIDELRYLKRRIVSRLS